MVEIDSRDRRRLVMIKPDSFIKRLGRNVIDANKKPRKLHDPIKSGDVRYLKVGGTDVLSELDKNKGFPW